MHAGLFRSVSSMCSATCGDGNVAFERDCKWKDVSSRYECSTDHMIDIVFTLLIKGTESNKGCGR